LIQNTTFWTVCKQKPAPRLRGNGSIFPSLRRHCSHLLPHELVPEKTDEHLL